MKSAILLILFGSAPLFAQQGFTPAQIDLIINQETGSEAKAQFIYHYFKADRDPELESPAWIDEVLGAMLKRPVWQDPEEGVLNEAVLKSAYPLIQ